MNRAHHRLTGLALGLLLLIAASGARPSTSLGGEFHFVIHDLEGEGAAWLPREVVIHKSTDLDGGLIFILENPTPRTHVFEAPGLFEQVVEGPEASTVKPLLPRSMTSMPNDEIAVTKLIVMACAAVNW